MLVRHAFRSQLHHTRNLEQIQTCTAAIGCQLLNSLVKQLQRFEHGNLDDPAPGQLLQQYQNAVQARSLLQDDGQAAVAARLSTLADDLVQYTTRLQEYRRDLAAYQDKRQRKREQLKSEDDRKAAEASARSETAWSRANAWWRTQVLGQQPAPQLSPAQQEVWAASEREKRLDKLLGPPVHPPAAPKGVYLYGEVGSGKSLLASMLYEFVESRSLVPLKRRLHFNSAMLEVNSRMWALEQERLSSEAVQDTVEHLHLRRSGDGSTHSTREHAASDSPADPSARQSARQAKLAAIKPKLAARRNRMLMLRRDPAQHSEALARSNAVILTRAAQALIRGGTSDGGELRGRQAALLYFDELQITDPFTAVSLKGIMEELVAEGAVLLITSNRHPDQLTNHGLHEDLFNHFMRTLLGACDIVHLGSGRDYRRLAASSQDVSSQASSFLAPLSPEMNEMLEQRWAALGPFQPTPEDLLVPVMFGRSIQLQTHQVSNGAVRFTFEQLCKSLMGAADYQALAQRFHTIFVTDIPALSFATRDQARRFITFIDEAYNHKVRLVASAAVPPDQLFLGASTDTPLIDFEGLQFESAAEGGRLRRDVMQAGGVAPLGGSTADSAKLAARLGGLEEQFAFRRAVSRLHEMQTQNYLQQRPR